MAKLTIEDLHNLTRKVEEIEKAGGEAFALTSFTPAMLIPVEAVDFDPWVPAANIFHGIGTLEDLVKKAEKNALHGTDPFCEEVTGGVRRNGEKIYKAPGELWDSTVWMCWDGGSEFIENPVSSSPTSHHHLCRQLTPEIQPPAPAAADSQAHLLAHRPPAEVRFS